MIPKGLYCYKIMHVNDKDGIPVATTKQCRWASKSVKYCFLYHEELDDSCKCAACWEDREGE